MAVRAFLGPERRRNYRPDYDPDLGIVTEAGLGKTVAQIAMELGIPLDEASSSPTILENHTFRG